MPKAKLTIKITTSSHPDYTHFGDARMGGTQKAKRGSLIEVMDWADTLHIAALAHGFEVEIIKDL